MKWLSRWKINIPCKKNPENQVIKTKKGAELLF